MTAERRREARIPGSHARFLLQHEGRALECRVVNLSRLGLGIELPEGIGNEACKTGEVILGSLLMTDAALESQLVVRVHRDRFVGLEYEKPTAAFLKSLIAFLTPAYVANSIFPIAKEHLGPHVEAIFHGDEFEAILFKAGRSRNGETMQFFVGGEMVEFSREGARLVPSPLVRSSNAPGGYDFVTEFSTFTNISSGTGRLAKALDLLKRIVDLWADCPPVIRTAVMENQKKYCERK